MKLDAEIFAVIDPATNEVLGDGECPALQSRPFEPIEVNYIRHVCDRPAAKAVKVKIVLCEELASGK